MPYAVHFMRRVRRADGFRVFEVPVGELRSDRLRGFLAAARHRKPILYSDRFDYEHARAAAARINEQLDRLAPHTYERGRAFPVYVSAHE